MPHKRDTFFDDSVLAEIAGRLKFGAKPLEVIIEEVPKVQTKPWVFPPHPDDSRGEPFGLRGFEYKALLENGLTLAQTDPLVQEAFRRFLQATRLKSPDLIQRVTDRVAKDAKARQEREDNIAGKRRAREQKIKNIEKSWTTVRQTILTRWKRIERSLARLLETNADLSSMADRDVALIKELERRQILVLESNRVQRINWTKFEDVSIEDINEIILFLDSQDSGGFIRPSNSDVA